MRDQLDQTLARFEVLEKQLLDPAVQANCAQMAAVYREHGSLAKLATKYRRFKEINSQIAEAREMIAGKDLEMRELAEAELPGLKEQREAYWNELLDMTVGGEDANRMRCVMEIRAGTGGDEAGLFARDLYDMYKHYADGSGWKVEILDMNPTELGGFKELVLGIEGEDAYRELQYESGGHRVQRVPETETKGRIHTSAATVAVMPEPEDVEIEIKPDDFRKDTFLRQRAGRAARQQNGHAVRLTHYETGIVVSCQDEKSQHKNFAKALRVLKTRLYEHEAQDRSTKSGPASASRWSARATAANRSARTIFPRTG